MDVEVPGEAAGDAGDHAVGAAALEASGRGRRVEVVRGLCHAFTLPFGCGHAYPE
jgi:nicotinamidase-related amidase